MTTPAPRMTAARRAEWITKARKAIAEATRAAGHGKQGRDLWVVVTSSYRLDIDPDTDQGRRNADLIAAGEFGAALEGVPPGHTAIGFRIAADADLANDPGLAADSGPDRPIAPAARSTELHEPMGITAEKAEHAIRIMREQRQDTRGRA